MNLLTKYIIAMTNFYGVVTPEIVVNVFNQQNETNITEEDVHTYLVDPPKDLANHFVFEEGGLFVQDSLFIGDDTLVNLIKEKNEKPYYVPTQEELLPYIDGNYIEKNEYYAQLFNYFKTHFPFLTDGFIEDICENFVYSVRENDINFGSILYQLEGSGILLTNEDDFSAVVQLVSDLGMNVRMWENNGFTRRELFEVQIENMLHREVYSLNVGPNYPCHCRSGKLYKDCCMEKDQKVKRLDDYRYE